jgi:hypothetical protein
VGDLLEFPSELSHETIVCSLCKFASEDPEEFDLDYGEPVCLPCNSGA